MEDYSNSFLGGEAQAAFAILSTRCQLEIGRASFSTLVQQAADVYGVVPIRAFSAKIEGSRAKVTYSYDVAKLNQINQPWLLQQGGWRYDKC